MSKPRSGILTWALWGAALLGVAAVVYIIAQASTKPPPQGPSPAVGSALAGKLIVPTAPTPAPDYAFYDSTGKAVKIADF
ncbi:MAG TPA: hypothetical protein VFH92_14360 [Phenylobacterium sp.]|nr:hypothetical protein [Phenylobacterium sp.]